MACHGWQFHQPAQLVLLDPAVSEDPDVLRDDAPQSVGAWGSTPVQFQQTKSEYLSNSGEIKKITTSWSDSSDKVGCVGHSSHNVSKSQI